MSRCHERLLSRHRAPPTLPNSWPSASSEGALTPRLSAALHTMLTADLGAVPPSDVVDAVRSLVVLSKRLPPALPAGAVATGAHREPPPPPDIREHAAALLHRKAPSVKPAVFHRSAPRLQPRGWARSAATEASDDLCAEELNASTMSIYRAAAGQSRVAW